MKIRTRLASLLILAGFLICSNGTRVNAATVEEDSQYLRNVDGEYWGGHYNYPMGFDQRDDVFYIRNSYSSAVEWEVEPADKQIYTWTEVYLRTIPNMEKITGVFVDYGTEIHLIGVSPNGWDIVEYEGNRYFLWYEYWSEEQPPIRTTWYDENTTRDYYIDDSLAEAYENEPPSGDGYYMGTYELTAYEWTGNPCADGNYPEVGITAASNDPALWGHYVHIEGYGDYLIHDTGGMANNVIDIYMGDVDTCYEFGRQAGDVYIID